MSATVLLLAGDALNIETSQLTSLGKVGVAGFGVATMYIAHKQANNNGLLYRKVPREKHDYLSLGLGLLAGSSLAKGMDTLWGLPLKLLTNTIIGLERIQIIADLGLGVVAVMLIAKLIYDDYKQPTLIKWGFGLSALLPLTGGALTILPNIAGYIANQITTGFTG